MATAPPAKSVPISAQPGVVQQLPYPVVVARLPEKFLPKPMDLICNVCHQHIRTTTEKSCNPICCFLWGLWALCLCQDVEHKCPNCNTTLGKYSASSC